jgi:hypothetical protein
MGDDELMSADEGSKSLVQRNEDAISLDDEDEPAFLALPNEEAQEGWYPTLRVTLWVLSCLWRYVDVSCLPHDLLPLLRTKRNRADFAASGV